MGQQSGDKQYNLRCKQEGCHLGYGGRRLVGNVYAPSDGADSWATCSRSFTDSSGSSDIFSRPV